MRIVGDGYCDEGITQLDICLRSVNNTIRMEVLKPSFPNYTIGNLRQPKKAKIVFTDSRELDTFINALVKLQTDCRENIGEWSVMRPYD